MKKTLALLVGAAACALAFTGCARKDDVDSNPPADNSSYVTEDSSYSSRSVADRAESTVDDVIDGGKRIVDDTASTAKDVVDNITD